MENVLKNTYIISQLCVNLFYNFCVKCRLMYEVVSSKNRCWIQVMFSDQIIWHPISDDEITIRCVIGSVE